MLELLFQGFIEWIYGLILECWEYFASVLFDLMSLDFAYLREHMPVIDTIRQIMLGVGWALLIGNLVFQATRGMAAGLGFDAEDPKLLFTRTFAFSFLLVASPQICELGLNMTSTVIELLQMPDAVDITFADEASFGGLTGSWLLVVICGIIVMFQTFKLIMEMAERYFTFCTPRRGIVRWKYRYPMRHWRFWYSIRTGPIGTAAGCAAIWRRSGTGWMCCEAYIPMSGQTPGRKCWNKSNEYRSCVWTACVWRRLWRVGEALDYIVRSHRSDVHRVRPHHLAGTRLQSERNQISNRGRWAARNRPLGHQGGDSRDVCPCPIHT